MTNTLEKKICEEVAGFPGKAAVLLSEMPVGGGRSGFAPTFPIVSLSAADRVVSASTIKVPVAMALFHRLREQGRSSDEKVHLDEKNILDDSEVFEYGSTDVSFRELTYWMLVNSDNTATNAIFRYLGYPYMNAYFQKIGLICTRAERCMLDWTAVFEGRNNYISANDYYSCCELLLAAAERRTSIDGKAAGGTSIARQPADGTSVAHPADDPSAAELVNSEDAAWILRTLAANRDYTCMMRYITEDVTLMHKTGELDDIIHDAGVFEYAGKRWFLGAFCSDFEPTEAGRNEARRLIGRIARLTLDEVERTVSASSVVETYDADGKAAESYAGSSNAGGSNAAGSNAAGSNAAGSNAADSNAADGNVWRHAIVTVPSAFLWNESGETVDEVLSGWAVGLVSSNLLAIRGRQCVEVETHYGYKGYLPLDCVRAVSESLIHDRQTDMITAFLADVLSEPRVQGRILETLPAGALVERVSAGDINVDSGFSAEKIAADSGAGREGMTTCSKPAAANGYTLIRTASGTMGYIPTRSHKSRPDSDGLFFAEDRAAFLHGQIEVLRERWEREQLDSQSLAAAISGTAEEGALSSAASVTLGENNSAASTPDTISEDASAADASERTNDFETSFRRRIAETAKGWIGTQYRWGGHTPAGTDCSGLVFMACMLNGLLVYRDAHMPEEYLVSEIYPEREEDLKMGDFIFFEGHVAMSLGGKRFIHSTGFARDFGVCIGSLDPADPGYRPDLAVRKRWYGSLFPPGH